MSYGQASDSESEPSDSAKTLRGTSRDNLVETLMVVPPDGGWGWVIVAICFLCGAIVDGVAVSFYLLRHQLTEILNVEQPQVALLGSVSYSAIYFIGPIGCGLANKFGFRIVMILGGIINGLGLVGCYFANTYTAFLIFYSVVGGIGGGLVYVSYSIPPGFWFDQRRAIAVSIASCGAGLGNVVVPLLSELFMNAFHWKSTFLLHAGLLAMTALLGTQLSPVPAVKVTIENIPKKQPADAQIRKKDPPKTNTKVKFTTNSRRLQSIMVGDREKIVQSKSQRLPRPAFAGAESTVMYVTLKRAKDPFCQRLFCCCCRCRGQSRAQPLLRRDVFYYGSLLRLKEYQSQTGHMEYQMSVSHLPLLQELDDITQAEQKPFYNIFLEMFDCNLFKNPIFLLISFYNFFFCSGFVIPYMYIKDHAIAANVSTVSAALLTPCVGVGNMLGRITSGVVLTLFPNLAAIKLAINSIMFAGVITIIVAFVDSFALHLTYAVTYGFSQGSVSPLRSLIIVDYLGLDKLTNATGLLLLFSGFGVLIGIPTADLLISVTGMMSSAFYFAGTSLILSAVMYLLVPYQSRKAMAEQDT